MNNATVIRTVTESRTTRCHWRGPFARSVPPDHLESVPVPEFIPAVPSDRAGHSGTGTRPISAPANCPATVTDIDSPPETRSIAVIVQSWDFIVERQMPGRSLPRWGTSAARRYEVSRTSTSTRPGRLVAMPAGRSLEFGRTATTLAWNGFLSANYHALQVSFNRRSAVSPSKALHVLQGFQHDGRRWPFRPDVQLSGSIPS